MRISIQHMSKTFEDGTQALADINLVIENGVFGLLGPNASGKSTLIRILSTLLGPTSGTVAIDGLDLQQDRGAIRMMTGYLPQSFSMFRASTTAMEFLDYLGRLAGIRDRKTRENEVSDLLFSLGLYEVREKNANDLTAVQKRHLEIAQAVIGNPRIILMDEPTANLSPEERIRFGKLLAERCRKVDIIVYSTHILSDISSTCNAMAVLEHGRLAASGAPELVMNEIRNREWLKGSKTAPPHTPTH